MRTRGLSIVFIEKMARLEPEVVANAIKRGAPTPKSTYARSIVAGIVRNELSRATEIVRRFSFAFERSSRAYWKNPGSLVAALQAGDLDPGGRNC